MTPGQGISLPLLLSLLASIVLRSDLTASSALPFSDDESDQTLKSPQLPFSESLTLVDPSAALLKAVAKTAIKAKVDEDDNNDDDEDDDEDDDDDNGAPMETAVDRKLIKSSVKHGLEMSGELPASPADLLRPDKFQFYTYNEQGDMITRQMTLKEIQTLIASGGAGQASLVEMHEPQKADDMFAGGKNVMEVVEKVQNVLRSALSKPSSANLMGSQPSIPEQANAEWSSILPSILSGDTESITLNETKEHLGQMEDGHESSFVTIQHSTSSHDKGTLHTLSNGTTITDQVTQKPSHTSSVRPDYPENPMIPVPVITAEQKLSTQLPISSNHSTVFEIMNVITTDDISSYKNESVDDQDIGGNDTSAMLATLTKISSPGSEITTVRTNMKTTVKTAPETTAPTTTATTLATTDYVRKPLNDSAAYIKITPVDLSMIQVKTSVPSTTTEKALTSMTSVPIEEPPVTLKDPTVAPTHQEYLEDSSPTISVPSYSLITGNKGGEMTSTVPSILSTLISYMNASKDEGERNDTKSGAIEGTSTGESSTEFNEIVEVSSTLAAPTRIDMANGTELSEELSDAFSNVMSQVSEAIPTVWHVSYTPDEAIPTGSSVTRIKLNDALDGEENATQVEDMAKPNLLESTRVTEPYQEARINELTTKGKLTTIIPIELVSGDGDDKFDKSSGTYFTATTLGEKDSISFATTPATSSPASSTIANDDAKETATVGTLYSTDISTGSPVTSSVPNDLQSHVIKDRLALDSVSVINQMLETVSVPFIPESRPTATVSLTLPTKRPQHLLNANTVASSLIAGIASTSASIASTETYDDSNFESTKDAQSETIVDLGSTVASPIDDIIASGNGNFTLPSSMSTTLPNIANSSVGVAKTAYETSTGKVESFDHESSTLFTTVALDNYYDTRPPSQLGGSADIKSIEESFSVPSLLPVKVTTTSYHSQTTNSMADMTETTVRATTRPTTMYEDGADATFAPEVSNFINRETVASTESVDFGTSSAHTISGLSLSSNDGGTVEPTVAVLIPSLLDTVNKSVALPEISIKDDERRNVSIRPSESPSSLSSSGSSSTESSESKENEEGEQVNNKVNFSSSATESSVPFGPTAVFEDIEKATTGSLDATMSSPLSSIAVTKGVNDENGKPPPAKTENVDEPVDAEWTLISQNLSRTETTSLPTTAMYTRIVTSEKSVTTEDTRVPLGISQTVSGLESSIRGTSSDVVAFSRLCNELAFSFWTATNKGLSTGRSLALSPFGMTSLLAMIFLGARGPTSEQMNELLGLDDVATFNPHLIFQNVTDAVGLARGQGIANAAFVRELFADKSKVRKLMPFYKEQAHQFYEGLIAEVNFATISDLARRRTNLLIRKQTGGRVKDFVRSNAVPLRAPLAALSANVFQTDCTASGASSIGRDGELYFAVSPAVRQRRLVPVPATVWRFGVLAGYEPSLDATAVALGGVDRLVSTIFLLPGQQGHAAPGDTLDRLEQRLVAGAFRDGAWDKLLKVLVPRTGLELQIPKFSHRSVVNATAALKRMGLDQLFSTHADLKGINGVGNRLHLADVLQMNLFSTCGDESMSNGRHHVEIYPTSSLRNSRSWGNLYDDTYESEELLTASPVATRTMTHVAQFLNRRKREKEAVTLTTTTTTTTTRPTMSVEKPRLKLDRPFLYFVRHNPTGLILHMGRFNPRLLP